jgi:hypothetical protein
MVRRTDSVKVEDRILKSYSLGNFSFNLNFKLEEKTDILKVLKTAIKDIKKIK